MEKNDYFLTYYRHFFPVLTAIALCIAGLARAVMSLIRLARYLKGAVFGPKSTKNR